MPDSDSQNNFRFEISLSVLNHLGRNLYRNFITVLGEAISNAWDADANNVWINIDRESSLFSIKDDGIGMDVEDFQSKFLKIGYSKRAGGTMATRKKTSLYRSERNWKARPALLRQAHIGFHQERWPRIYRWRD
jgi:HSP90 family molecular chaperone